MSFLSTRGQLAKLLATENLSIEHDASVKTASFNVKDRVLILPVLKTDNEHVYNLMLSHEVGHALATPQDWMNQIPDGVHRDIVNVCEDVRIEKLIQTKFPGLKRDYTRGYDFLHEADFFSIADKDVSAMSLVDRINLHFKLGSRALIEFTPEEQDLVDAVDSATTFAEVVAAAKRIAAYQKMARDTDSEALDMPGNDDGKEGDDQQPTDSGSASQQETEESGDAEPDQNSGIDPDADIDAPSLDKHEEGSQTQQSFDENMGRMTEDSPRNNIMYATVPDIDLEKDIVTIDKFRESVDTDYHDAFVGYSLDAYYEYLTSTKKEVNFMVQQFEMRKRADAYSRIQQHKTGVLDTNNLHNYKITEDLFLRQDITPDGKSHGLVMMVDWSGSMADILMPTVKQILTLVSFCRKAQIPFDVYSFTSGERYIQDDDSVIDGHVSKHNVQMVHLLTSNAKRTQIDTDMKNFFMCARGIVGYGYSSPYTGMGGTPLNNALMMMPEVIKQFKQRNNVQRVSFVCLTDGESSPLSVIQTINRNDGVSYKSLAYSYYSRILIRHGQNVSAIKEFNETGGIAHWLSQVTGASVTNIFVAGPAQAQRYASSQGCYNFNDSEFKKNLGANCTPENGWGLITLMHPKRFVDSSDEIEVEDGATKAQIRTALRKMLSTKTKSRSLLTTLVEQFS